MTRAIVYLIPHKENYTPNDEYMTLGNIAIWHRNKITQLSFERLTFESTYLGKSDIYRRAEGRKRYLVPKSGFRQQLRRYNY